MLMNEFSTDAQVHCIEEYVLLRTPIFGNWLVLQADGGDLCEARNGEMEGHISIGEKSADKDGEHCCCNEEFSFFSQLPYDFFLSFLKILTSRSFELWYESSIQLAQEWARNPGFLIVGKKFCCMSSCTLYNS